jgi:rhomboid family GlyGly-CTERM serine protease
LAERRGRGVSVDALEWLRWSREHIAAGEYWRLITGHLVHLGAGHALVNALGAVIVWTVFREPLSSRLVVWAVLAGFVTVNAGLWFGTELQWYVGASGVLHALAAAGIVQTISARGGGWPWTLGLLGAGKLLYEQWQGPLGWTPGSPPVITAAHLYGAAGGVLAALASIAARRISSAGGG